MDDVEVNGQLTIPSAELSESFARSGGPGGQHVNKTATKVELRWSVRDSAVLDDATRGRLMARLGDRLAGDGELIVVCGDHRSQHRNREEARERLAAIVRSALVVRKRRRKTRPSRRAVERRIEAKKRRGQRKKDRRWRPD